MSSTVRISVEAALVTVQAIRVDGKRLSIAAYNQMPLVEERDGDAPLYWVNRCPAQCHGHLEPTRHVLASRDGAPVILTYRDTAASLARYCQSRREEIAETRAEIRERRSALATYEYKTTTTRRPNRPRHFEYDHASGLRRYVEHDRDPDEEHALARDWIEHLHYTRRKLDDALSVFAAHLRELREASSVLDYARARWAEALALPQGYIAV